VKAVAAQLGVRPLLNRTVTSKRLAQEASRSAIIHLACHGTQWAEEAHFDMAWSPPAVLRLRSGGLTFQDILTDWDLRSTDLIVLSACDTGLVNFFQPWDEFAGLSHVLLQAGAHSILSSLWSVDDESTGLLMAKFYHSLTTERLAGPLALSNAQRWLRESTASSLVREFPELYHPDPKLCVNARPFAHPYFWAPFYYTG